MNAKKCAKMRKNTHSRGTKKGGRPGLLGQKGPSGEAVSQPVRGLTTARNRQSIHSFCRQNGRKRNGVRQKHEVSFVIFGNVLYLCATDTTTTLWQGRKKQDNRGHRQGDEEFDKWIKTERMLSNITIIDEEYKQWVIELAAKYRRSQIKASVKVNQQLLGF